MDQSGTTTRARVAAAAAGTVMAFSAGVVAYGIVDSSTPASLGGGLVGLAAAAMMHLAKTRAWSVAARVERRRLDVERLRLEDARQQAHDERTRYIALGEAQHQEHRRRIRDLEAERVANQQDLVAAKAGLVERYEAQREALIVESMEIGVSLYLAGLRKAPTETINAKIFRLPEQPTPQPRERTVAHPADVATQPVREREVRHP
ncbi:hypothetical protein [Streptomyces sp. NPDC093093]|uniref:hypothetical protein n=1 Tax=Streptomyces sp. NPDC093093 TaxID=3366025 RepID=UPI00380726EA